MGSRRESGFCPRSLTFSLVVLFVTVERTHRYRFFTKFLGCKNVKWIFRKFLEKLVPPFLKFCEIFQKSSFSGTAKNGPKIQSYTICRFNSLLFSEDFLFKLTAFFVHEKIAPIFRKITFEIELVKKFPGCLLPDLKFREIKHRFFENPKGEWATLFQVEIFHTFSKNRFKFLSKSEFIVNLPLFFDHDKNSTFRPSKNGPKIGPKSRFSGEICGILNQMLVYESGFWAKFGKSGANSK